MKRYTIYLLALLLVAGGCRSSRQLTSYERAGIGAQIGSFFGWLFGQGVGRAIGDDQGEAIGGAVGYMAGGVAGSTIAYNKAEREKVAKTETAREYDIAPGTMSIPLLSPVRTIANWIFPCTSAKRTGYPSSSPTTATMLPSACSLQ